MTEMQREMQNRISQEELDRAFDARFPKKMQEKLRNAKVAVAGLGGLGSHIAVMLARSGIGKLRLVDFDDESEPSDVSDPATGKTEARGTFGDFIPDQSVCSV